MNVLLTGGAGYIGSHIAISLIECGHNVVLYDNLSNSKLKVVENISKIVDRKISFIEGDIRDTELLIGTLRSNKIDAVIHLAGLKAVGESVLNPIDYYANNFQGTISLLQAMQVVGVKNLVFSSSATVYGSPQYLPIDESHPVQTTNPYGRSKLYIEGMLNDVSRSDDSWRIISLRYFNPVGAHESGLIGEDPKGVPNNLVPFIAQVAAGQREELMVFGNDYKTVDGTGVRDYIHVMDLAEGHSAALNYLDKTTLGWSVFNLGTGKGYSVLEMVKAFEAASGQAVPYRIVARRPGDIEACYAQADKASQELSWIAKRDLMDMCSSAWHFQSNHNGL